MAALNRHIAPRLPFRLCLLLYGHYPPYTTFILYIYLCAIPFADFKTKYSKSRTRSWIL